MPLDNKRYSALLIGIAIIALVFSAGFFSMTKLLNGFVYDKLITSYSNIGASERLLVIEANSQSVDSGDEVWLQLLKNLLSHNVDQVVFNFLPEHVSENFYQLAVNSGKVIFGRKLTINIQNREPQLQELPSPATGKTVTFGLVDTAQSDYGVYRKQTGSLQIGNLMLPSMEIVAAQRLMRKDTRPVLDKFRLNFIGGTARLPKIDLKRALTGGLISELVSGRTVLVGVPGLESSAGYFTPISDSREQVSDVLFHGFALDTLLSDIPIVELPHWSSLLVIALITVGEIFLCQWLSFQMSLLVSVLLTVSYISICWSALHIFSLWVPFVELFFAQWLTFGVVSRYRAILENQALDQILLNLSTKLQEKAFPVSFYRSEDHWTQLITMINQTLNLNRLVFLERVKGDHRLKEIAAYHCSIDDVIEQRRDFERTPYSSAILENKPILLDRPYLKVVDVNEYQYLAPLIFAGDILGFWAFSIDPTEIKSNLKFVSVTQTYMEQISEALHYRQEWQKQLESKNNPLMNYFHLEGGTSSCQSLDQSVILLERRNSELQQVFNSLNTCGILYDLFGKVLLVNKRMEELAQSVNLRPYNITALDFIIEVTGNSMVDTRNLLQKVILDQEALSLPASIFGENNHQILHVKPLKTQNPEYEADFISLQSNEFLTSGILCELVDITEINATSELKKKMFERFSLQTGNELESALSSLSKLKTSDNQNALLLNSIQGKINNTLATLKAVSGQMNIELKSLFTNKLQCYPVDGLDALAKAIDKLKDYMAVRAVKLHFEMPALSGLVFASPAELSPLFHTVLLTIIDDTYEAGDVWVEIEEKADWVHYRIRNNGIGIAADNKSRQFDDDNPTTQKMVHAINCVNNWGGSLDISSQIGEGSSAELSLKRFI
ncbi:MAG: CHASE2 domain-containing protein [Methylococcaceae bacterium]|nr:CHASE2 domain-containing protein [Methylococcaceae bacterium]